MRILEVENGKTRTELDKESHRMGVKILFLVQKLREETLRIKQFNKIRN